MFLIVTETVGVFEAVDGVITTPDLNEALSMLSVQEYDVALDMLLTLTVNCSSMPFLMSIEFPPA